MSGPALRQLVAHKSIHDAAFDEAEELTHILRQTLLNHDVTRAFGVANLLLEHWETRTLRHAQEEEEGFYKELTHTRPELQNDIIRLTRDHDFMRRLAVEIKERLSTEDWVLGTLERFEALLLMNAFHSREEETCLLSAAHSKPLSNV